jgi:signal transduction histidine kinase
MTIQDIRPVTEVATLQVELGMAHPVSTGPAAFRHRCKDGTILSTEIRTRALDFDGRPARMVLAEDVTSRLALEAALRQSQKMEAIGRLAGGVAHDFNNFLTVIMTYVELAREGLPATDPRAADLEAVTAAAERAHALTRQLLAFTRQQVVQPVILDPNEALRPVESMLRRLLGEDITIELRRDPSVGRVRMDPGQFEQVFMNLAVNARDAMPDGGTLTITTSSTDLDEESSRLHGLPAPGRFAVVVVADTGTGMPPEVRTRIFEPFFTTKEVGKGTGLGLATVYGIVAQAGGSISLYSELGMGATFRIYLPEVALDPSGPAVPPPPETAPRGSETILLVEDDAAVRSAAEAVLRRLGYSVLVAPGAAEAIALMAHHAAEVHLVVSDVVMPGTDGPTLLEGIQRDYPRVRGLMMSGYAGEVLANRRAMVGEMAFLEKPFTVLALAKKVREVLDRS